MTPGVPSSGSSGLDPEMAARPPVALYIHVPFCLAVCPYCDFVVHGGAAARGPRSRVAAFLDAVHVELRLRADALDALFPARPPLGSLYLGGGTPSLVAPAAVAALVSLVRECFGLVADAEVTLEANPGADEIGDLAAFRDAGVDRLSIGAQSLDGDELRALGRRHSPEDVARAVASARAAGMRSVSVDLLYDVPGQSLETWERTLEGAVALRPDHVSTYALSLDDPDLEGLTRPDGDHLPVRRGARRWRERARLRQGEDRAAAMHDLAAERLEAAGLPWYELANRARPGHESRHNLAYWRRLPHEAAGPGAHAFDGATSRRWNAADLARYLAALLPPAGGTARLPPGGAERLDRHDVAAEQAILGLRLSEGIPGTAAGDPRLAGGLAWGVENGLLDQTPRGRLVLSRDGRRLANEVFERLLPPVTRSPDARVVAASAAA